MSAPSSLAAMRAQRVGAAVGVDPHRPAALELDADPVHQRAVQLERAASR